MAIRRAVQAGTIWLTAVMTLIAGTPHLVCRCPNGRVKPFCFALLSGKNGGCCDGPCCSAFSEDDGKDLAAGASLTATVAQKTCCCCETHQDNAKNESRSDSKLGKEKCQKTLVEGIVAVPAPAVKAPVQDLTAHLFVPASEFVTAQDRFGASERLCDTPCDWPPPTDLVTLLQHFLI